jgi:hypothetical protein
MTATAAGHRSGGLHLPHRTKPRGVPGVDRPRLLSDIPASRRIGILVALAVGGLILGHVVRYDWAAVYYNALETNAAVTAAWHGFLSVAWQRHLARFGVEGLYTSAVVQAIFYGIKRWPPRAAGAWTRYVKRYLLVPSDRLPDQTLWCLALSWLWIIVWAIPLGVLITLILDVTGTGNQPLTISLATVSPLLRSDVSLANWQQPILGFALGFIASRHVIKGTAFHFQRLVIKQTLEARDTRGRPLLPAPVWMRLFPYLRWRYEWSARRVQSGHMRIGSNRVWSHPRAQRRFHMAMGALGLLAWLVLTYQGWHILTYLVWSFTHPFALS